MNSGRLIVFFIILTLIGLTFFHIFSLRIQPTPPNQEITHTYSYIDFVLTSGSYFTSISTYTTTYPFEVDQIHFSFLVKLLIFCLIFLSSSIALLLRRKREIKEY